MAGIELPQSILTDEAWESRTKDHFIALCEPLGEVLKSNPGNPEAYEGLRFVMYDVLSAVIRGQIRPESVLEPISAIIQNAPQACNVYTDLLLVLDLETSDKPEDRERYLKLVNLSNNKLVSDWLLKERLDYETAADAKIIPNFKLANTRFVRFKTRLFWKQQKFNLFREESEGYAKLITELVTVRNMNDTEHMLTVIKSLIGCFNLDPNRVLDLILEAMECLPECSTFYLELLKLFMPSPTTLCQILAFKFSFYHNNANKEVTPDSLCTVTAQLISDGIFELDDIYPYLLPSDKDIVDFHKQDLEIATNVRKRVNIVAVGGNAADAEAKQIPEEVPLTDEQRHKLHKNNQKVLLLVGMLKLGDWNNAKQLIAKLPEFFSVADKRVSQLVCSMVNISLEQMFREYQTLPPPIMKYIESIKPTNASQEQLVARSLDDLKKITFPLIGALGPFLHRDIKLLVKIIRLLRVLYMKHCVPPSALKSTDADDDTDSPSKKPRNSTPKKPLDNTDFVPCLWLRNELLTLLDDSILPAFSALDGNSALLEVLWSLVSLLPYNVRYRLYTSWKAEPLRSALLLRNRAQIHKRIKYIMKRLSKETVKLMGRNIGKLSHSNPPFLFDYILSQIQTYDNMIGPVADSLKYCSNLGYDVLVFCIIECLANPNRERTQFDGAGISPWIIALSQFTGALVRKYPVDLTGLLQFITNQLKATRSLDLLVLKEVIQKMAGIEIGEELTKDKLDALTGGELLRSEGGVFNAIRNVKKASGRLKEALMSDQIAMPLCILIAQQRNCIVFQENAVPGEHIKLIGKLYDHCQETIIQYGSFLSSMMSVEDYVSILPPDAGTKFFSDYHLNPDIAFFILRPMITHHITKKYDELRRNESKNSITPAKLTQLYGSACDNVIGDLVSTVVPCFETKFWEEFNARFFVTFWTMTMYDIQVPTEAYDRENKRLREQIQQADDNKDLAMAKRKKERERCLAIMQKLVDEETQQSEHVKRVQERLRKDCLQWFDARTQKMEMTTKFLQYCLFPRAIFSALDAHYCAKFVQLLHSLRTPNFSTLICYDRIFGDITYTLVSCTEQEAHNYGRFLCSLLTTVMHWHKDKAIFEAECAKFPGFVTKFCESNPVHVDYEDYRHVCHKWHYRLTKAFIVLLESKEYIQIRNALIVLTRIISHFPVITHFATVIEKRVEAIREDEKEKRRDLAAIATGYAGQLKSRKAHLIVESDFHHKTATPKVVTKPDSRTTMPPPGAGAEVNGVTVATTNKPKANGTVPAANGSAPLVNGTASKGSTKSKSKSDEQPSAAAEDKKTRGASKTNDVEMSNATTATKRIAADATEDDSKTHKRRKTDDKDKTIVASTVSATTASSRGQAGVKSSSTSSATGRKRGDNRDSSTSPDMGGNDTCIMILDNTKKRGTRGGDDGHGGRDHRDGSEGPAPPPSSRSSTTSSKAAATPSSRSSSKAGGAQQQSSTITSISSSTRRSRHDK